MPTIVTEAPYRPVPTNPPRKRGTRAECAAFQATGLWDQQRLELVEGELINKIGKNRPYAVVAITVRNWLIAIFGLSYVETEDPIDVAPHDNPTSEPEPDIMALVRPATEFERNPQPADLRLVVEISDSTVGFDLTTKAGLYARACITDYWVFDIGARRLLVHRDPHHGKHQSITAYSEHECVAPLAVPESQFRVGDAFPA